MSTHRTLRTALLPLLFAAAGTASAGVITMDGVVFTTTYTGNVLTLEIDAAKRSGGWAGATAIDALAIKTVGSFDGVKMTSSTGADWALSSAELNASGCGGKAKGKAGNARICYSGEQVKLADNMVFTFTFDGSPTLGAPHLKVHFVNDSGAKVGSLLSMDFPWQAETVPVAPAPEPKPEPKPEPQPQPQPQPEPAPGGGEQQGGGANGGGTPQPPVDPVPVPEPDLNNPGGGSGEEANTPVTPPADNQSGDVPEPHTLAILGAGLAGLCVARRRRNGKA